MHTNDHDPRQRREINVGEGERLASTLVGGALVTYGLKQRSLVGALMTLAGGAMVYRGITGHCHLYDALDLDTRHGLRKHRRPEIIHLDPNAPHPRARDPRVDEAVWESFPASDVPTYSAGTL